MEWYAFDPVATLLFKGAEPMEMGADHHASQIFPPPAQTIVGALRTAVLLQHGLSFKSYYKAEASSTVLSAIGKAEDASPFEVTGPLFRIGEQFFVPAPFSWFRDKPGNNRGKRQKAKVYKAEPLKSTLVKTEDETLFWAKGGSGEMSSLGGNWLVLEDLFSEAEEKDIFHPDYFFTTEARTGIALNANRSVRDGHLYTFTHVRMKPDVTMVFGVDSALPLAAKGVLKLGAEQRFGCYEKIAAPFFSEKNSGTYLALTQVEGTEKANKAAIATGKIQYIGGWDLKKGFHKPMKGFFPAGSVFADNIHPNFVQI